MKRSRLHQHHTLFAEPLTNRWQTGAKYLVAWSLWIVVSCSPVIAEPLPKAEIPEELAYRAIQIDSEHLSSWIAPGQRYLPLKRNAFSRLFQDALAASQAILVPIRSMQFNLRIAGDGFLIGTVDIDIEYPLARELSSRHFRIVGPIEKGAATDEQIDYSADPQSYNTARFLELDPKGLSVTDAAWIMEDGKSLPARWGTSGWSAQDGENLQGVLIDRPGILRLNFLAKGYQDGLGISRYNIHFPTAPLQKLVLDYAQELSPEIDGACILAIDQADFNRRRVEYRLAPQQPIQLTIHNPAMRRSQCRKANVQHHTQYVASKRGLDIMSDFWITSPDDLPAPFWMVVEQGVAIKSIEIDGKPAQWSYEDPSTNEQTRIHFQPRDHTNRHMIHIAIHGMANVHLNASWRLPKLRLEDVFWSQGSVTLSVKDPLLMDSLEIADCMQVSATPNTGDSSHPDTSKTLRFEEFTSTATIDVQLVRRQEIPPSCPLMVAVVGAQGISAKAIIELPLLLTTQKDPLRDYTDPSAEENIPSSNETPIQDSTVPSGSSNSEINQVAIVRTLKIPVGDNWAIESVEGIANVTVRDWFIQTKGKTNILSTTISTLAPGKSQEHHSRLIIHGQRYTPLAQTEWRTNDFNMIQLRSNADASTRIYLQPAPKFGLYRSDEKPLEATTSANGDSELLMALGSAHNSIFYPMPDQDSNTTLRLKRRGPEFEAALDNHVELTGSLLNQTLEIEIVLREGLLDTVDVDVIGGMADQIAWQLAGDQKPIAAQCILHHLDDSSGHRFARWRLPLSSHNEGSIRLQGVVHSPINIAGPLLMASVHRANQQEGHIHILCMPTNSIRIDSIGLVREGILSASPDTIPESCGLYRYNPNHDVGLYAGPSIVLHSHEGPTADPWAWVRSAELHTVASPDGQVRYTAVMHVETTGLDHLTCRLPVSAEIIDLTVDGRAIPLPIANQKGSKDTPSSSTVLVELPAKERYPVVRIHYTVPEKPFGTIHRMRPSIIVPSLSVAAWRWSLMIPTEYKIISPFESERSVGQSVTYRILGPFALLENNTPETSVLPNPLGWHEYSTDLDLPVYLVHTQTLWLLFLLFFCILVALMVGPLANYGWCQAGLLVLSCAAILILPLAWAPIASGAFLGCAAAILARSIRTRLSTRFFPWYSKPKYSFAATVTQANSLVIFLSLFAVPAMHAGDTLPQPDLPATQLPDRNSRSRFHHVLVPIGRDRQSTGDSVFLTDRFYRLLLIRNHQRLHPAGDWLITKADYTGRLTIGEKLISNSSWAATYHVHSFIRDAWLHLPLDTEEAEWNPHAIVDGIEVPITWIAEDSRDNNSGIEPGDTDFIRITPEIRKTPSSREDTGMGRCAILLSEPGLHQIQIRFVPKTRTNGATEEWSIQIPKIMNSELVLTTSGMDVAPDSIHVDGAISVTTQGGKHHYQLKNSDRLTVHHQSTLTTSNAGHQLLRPRMWFHINPDSIRLSLSLRILKRSKSTNSIALHLDPRLEFLGFDNTFPVTDDPEKEISIDYLEGSQGKPVVHDGSQSDASSNPSDPIDIDTCAAKIETDDVASDNKQVIQLSWDQPEEKPLDIRLLFELSGSSGIGKFQLPQIDYYDIRTLKAEIGLTVAEPLELEMDPSPSALVLDPKQFAAAWGDGLIPPKRAFEIPYFSTSGLDDPSRNPNEFIWSVRYRKSSVQASHASARDQQTEPSEDAAGDAELVKPPEKTGISELPPDSIDPATASILSDQDSDPPVRPLIKSANIHLLRDSAENTEMTACLSVLSGGASGCDLVLPVNCQLLYVTLSDIPIAAVRNANHTRNTDWRIELNASPEPQLIRIHYRIESFAPTGQHCVHLPAPQLVIQGKWVPAERVYWYVSPHGTRFPQTCGKTSSKASRLSESGPFLTHDLSPLAVVWTQQIRATAVRRTAVVAIMLIAVGSIFIFTRVGFKAG